MQAQGVCTVLKHCGPPQVTRSGASHTKISMFALCVPGTRSSGHAQECRACTSPVEQSYKGAAASGEDLMAFKCGRPYGFHKGWVCANGIMILSFWTTAS
jgi:hypothetical protein